MTADAAVVSSKSAFLDTNALVSLFEFREVCNVAGLSLTSVTDWLTLKTALQKKNIFASELNKDDAGIVFIGMKNFQKLSNNSQSYQFYSSTVCRSEMHHVLLEALGLERLLQRKVPRGLRVKRPQVLYRRALRSSDYTALQSALSEFFESLRLDYGIDIVEVERTSPGTTVRVDDVWSTAQELWSRVLIEVIDSYIYAAAVEIEADAFVTSDGSLYDALARLNKPQGEWVSLVTSLKEALGKPINAALPQPIGTKESLPV